MYCVIELYIAKDGSYRVRCARMITLQFCPVMTAFAAGKMRTVRLRAVNLD